MRKTLIFILVTLVIIFSAIKSDAVLGIPDRIVAATLLVPGFSVSVNPAIDSLNTLPVVTNTSGSSIIVHYEVWDVLGRSTNIFGNFTLGPRETRPMSIRALIESAPFSERERLRDDDYWFGFMTFDVVTSPTDLRPIDSGYPFSNNEVLEGWIYYVRLLQGSSNGISMVPIEVAPPGTPPVLRGFYTFGDNREAIDLDARYSAERLTRGSSAGIDPDGVIDRITFRVYRDPINNGETIIVLFTRKPDTIGGPGWVPYRIYNEAGTLISSGPIDLNKVVNILEVLGISNGWVSILNIPYDWHVYGFSINSASPGFNPALTWDAIFEAYVLP